MNDGVEEKARILYDAVIGVEKVIDKKRLIKLVRNNQGICPLANLGCCNAKHKEIFESFCTEDYIYCVKNEGLHLK